MEWNPQTLQHTAKMKAHYLLWSILAIIISTGTPITVLARTIEVHPQGPGIGKTVKEARPHDTILVRSGTYREFNILIDKPLVIQGIDHPIIDGAYQGEIIRITSDSVTLDGLIIRGVQTSYTQDHAAIRVVQSRDFVLQNLILEDFFFGIYLQKSHHGRISHNIIRGNASDEFGSGNGIHLWYAQQVMIENNTISGARDGIYIEFADSCLIRNNHSHHNIRYGLHFMFSNHDRYENNTFENNGAGVAVMFSRNIDMIDNIFTQNWGPSSYGLLLKEIYDAEISGNSFIKNTTGIQVEGSNRIIYTRNSFIENGWGLKIRGAIYTNHFTYNNFLHNSFDLAYNSQIHDNEFKYNYWSRYSGYDLDKDGIGDVPYRPVNLFSYIVNRIPESIILLRSLFMDIIDFSEKVSPSFTPDNLIDPSPLMKKII